jgi:rRNA maturation endonuclease Nob1
MQAIVLDSNAVIMHGRSFPDRVRRTVDGGRTVILPRAVKEELVDDVLATEESPPNHRESARAIQDLIDEGVLAVRRPDFERYSDVIDEARRRIAGESLPEHAVKADQYIPALVCERAREGPVCLVTADGKLQNVVRAIVERRDVSDSVRIERPMTVLSTGSEG